MDKVRKGVNSDFVLMDDDTLKFKDRLCIPHVGGLRRELLEYSITLGLQFILKERRCIVI